MAWDDMNDLFWLRGEPAGAPAARGAAAGAAVAQAWTAGRAQRERERSNRVQESLEAKALDIRDAENNTRYWNTILDDNRSAAWLKFNQDQRAAALQEQVRKEEKLRLFSEELQSKVGTVPDARPGDVGRRLVNAVTSNSKWLLDPDTADAAKAVMGGAKAAIDMEADAVKQGKAAEMKAAFNKQLNALPPQHAATVFPVVSEYGETDPRSWEALRQAGVAAAKEKEEGERKPKVTFEDYARDQISQVRSQFFQKTGVIPTEREVLDRLKKEWEALNAPASATPGAGAYDSFLKWKQTPK